MDLRHVVHKRVQRLGWDVGRWPLLGDAAGHALAAVREHHVSHIIDVGANEGQFAKYMRHVGYNGYITSFEPIPAAYADCVRLARRDPKWTIHNVAIGNQSGSARLNICEATEMSSLLPFTPNYTERATARPVVETIGVRVATLDEYDQSIEGSSLLLKTDTQGYDTRVLKGASHLLERVRVLLIELAVRPNYEGADNLWRPTIDWIEAMGLELGGLFPIGFDGERRVREMDGLFIRPR